MATGTSKEAQELWSAARVHLKRVCGTVIFEDWIAQVESVSMDNGVLRLHAPTRFLCYWINIHYADTIAEACRNEYPGLQRVEITPAPHTPPPPPHDSKPAPSPVSTPGRRGTQETRGALGESFTAPFESPLNAAFTFERFVKGPSNELAFAAVRSVAADRPGHPNPLFLHGGVGLGKTHLLHALAADVRRSRARLVLYLSGERFRYHFVSALREKDPMRFKAHFQHVDLLILDDIQFISGPRTEEEFFHIFNEMMGRDCRIVVSATCPPGEVKGLEARIRSRLSGGLVVDIAPGDYALRLNILRAKLNRAEQRYAPRPVLEFIARHITSNARELEGALNRILAYGAHAKAPVSLSQARQILRDLLKAAERQLSIVDIQRAVAEHFDIPVSEMSSPRRAREVARPRQIAMFLAKQLTTRSLPDIGRRFGGRDHTTVIHAVRRIEALKRADAQIDSDLDAIRRALRG